MSPEDKAHMDELEKRLADQDAGIQEFQYQYSDTNEVFWVSHHKDEVPLSEYNNRPCHPVIHKLMILSDVGKPRTLGSLAEKNTEKMIKEGSDKIKRKSDNPWWRPNKDKPFDIHGKTPKQVRDYIFRGKS